MSATKIGKNITNNLNCYLSKKIYTLTHQTKSLNIEKTIYMKTKFTGNNLTSHKILFSRNAEKTHIDQSIPLVSFTRKRKKTLTNLQK